MKFKKILVLTSLAVSSVFFMSGCSDGQKSEQQPSSEPTQSAHAVAEPSDYSTKAPDEPKPVIHVPLQESDQIIEVTDGIKKVYMTFSGEAEVMELKGEKTKKIPMKLEYKVKQAILDTRVRKVPKMTGADVRCTADDFAVKIIVANDETRYRPCEYTTNYHKDPLFIAARELLEEVY